MQVPLKHSGEAQGLGLSMEQFLHKGHFQCQAHWSKQDKNLSQERICAG